MNYTYPQNTYTQQQYRPIQQQSWTIPQVRPVSSVEEVRAYPIEFDGSIFYFPDIANKKIYTKFVNTDGSVTINLYELKDLTIANQTMDSSTFVTRNEFEETINQIKQFIMQQQQEIIPQSAAQPKPIEFQF